MGQIYKIYNNINSKIYIGKTVNNATKHFKEHCFQINNGTAIHNAMKKYGIENFFIEVIEDNIFDKEILSEREKYWINFYNALTPYGYNIASGGEGGNGTHAKNLEKWRKENNDIFQNNIEKLIEWQKLNPEKVKENNIQAAKTRKQRYGNELTKKANESTRKKVRCIETNQIFNSASEAASFLGHSSGAHIGQVCNGQRKTCFGLHWEWCEKEVK